MVALEPGGRRTQLERPPVTEYPVVYLGDSPEAAETKLRAFMETVDLDAIAGRIVETIQNAEPGDAAWWGRCTNAGRVQYAVRGGKLRERILTEIGDG